MIKRVLQNNKKEKIAYLFWGVASSVLNVVLYTALVYVGINYQSANFITLVTVKLFCYFTNKFFVFHTRCKNVREFLSEFVKFFAARMMTFLMDYFGLILLVEKIGANKFVSKVFLTAAVIVVNYCLSKIFVFHSRREDKDVS